MSAAHAAGPWRVDLAIECPNVRIVGPNGRGLAVALQRDPHPSEGQGITDEEALANAVLIAAAPELLEALQTILEVWPNKDKKPGWCDRWMRAQANASAAIAKATGGEA